MPKGIVLIGWTNKEGFFLIHKFPSDVELTDEEIMRIGSTHRMRNLDANVISIRQKDLNIVSFFSGLITSKYHIAPNFVISLILDQDENPKDYINVLPKGAEMVLSEFPIKRFDARTTSFQDILSKIGQSYMRTLPKLYNALIKQEIEVKPDMGDFLATIARDLETPTVNKPVSESEIIELQKKLEEQEGVIKMLQGMLEGKDYLSESTEYIAKIETLKTQIANLEQRLKEKDATISEQELQLARIDLLQTRIETLQSDIMARDAEIADLQTKLTVTIGLPETISSQGPVVSSDQTQIWKNKVLELQNELLDRNSIINKLKSQLAGRLDDEEARSVLAELSTKLASPTSGEDELNDEMKSHYINL